MSKKIIFSKHALEQLITRKIQKRNVHQAIKNPENKIKSFRGRELRQKVFNGKILEVVIYDSKEQIAVITQYFLEKEINEN